MSRTKAIDAAGKPKVLWHFSDRKVDRFWPLTHFGTLFAAEERMYDKFSSQPPDQSFFYPCFLDIRAPIPIKDRWSGDDSAFFLSVFSRNGLLSAKEIRHCFGFDDSNRSALSSDDLKAELAEGGLFSSRGLACQSQEEPSAYTRHLKILLMRQRTVLALEKRGYDGFVYVNECEDPTSVSWVTFRPEQIYQISEPILANEIQRTFEKEEEEIALHHQRRSWIEAYRNIPQPDKDKLHDFESSTEKRANSALRPVSCALRDAFNCTLKGDFQGLFHAFRRATGRIQPDPLPPGFHGDQRYIPGHGFKAEHLSL